MDNLYLTVLLLGMSALAILHVWCISALFSHRFGLLRSVLWFPLLVLVPLIGPIIFVFSTRRFRDAHRPARKVQLAWFSLAAVVSMVLWGYISIQQYRQFNRARSDVDARYELKSAVARVEEFSETAGRLPATLKEAGYEGPQTAIHVTYRQTGPLKYEMSAWNDKGRTTYRARSGSSEFSRERWAK